MSNAGPQSLRRLLDAVVAVGRGLDLATTLQRITEVAVDLAGASYGALGVLDGDGTRLAEFITVGVDDETHAAIGALPEGQGILGLLIDDGMPLRLPVLQEHPDSFGFPPGHPPMRSFLGVPILVRGEAFGNLYLTEKVDAPEFTEVDEELIVGLAAAAGVAIDNARLHSRVSELRIFEERERIARDLHDNVIQRLFATGLTLQGTIPLVGTDPEAATQRVGGAVEDLDETVRQIRAAIFSLEVRHPRVASLTRQVESLCRESTGALGFAPVASFDGPVDDVVGEAASDLLATLREGLSNVARHARTSSVTVTVGVEASGIALHIIDEGVGPPSDPSGEGNGLANMAARAERHGGRSALTARHPVGSMLEWWIPRR